MSEKKVSKTVDVRKTKKVRTVWFLAAGTLKRRLRIAIEQTCFGVDLTPPQFRCRLFRRLGAAV